MQRSEHRILTTHAGGLPRPAKTGLDVIDDTLSVASQRLFG